MLAGHRLATGGDVVGQSIPVVGSTDEIGISCCTCSYKRHNGATLYDKWLDHAALAGHHEGVDDKSLDRGGHNEAGAYYLEGSAGLECPGVVGGIAQTHVALQTLGSLAGSHIDDDAAGYLDVGLFGKELE